MTLKSKFDIKIKFAGIISAILVLFAANFLMTSYIMRVRKQDIAKLSSTLDKHSSTPLKRIEGITKINNKTILLHHVHAVLFLLLFTVLCFAAYFIKMHIIRPLRTLTYTIQDNNASGNIEKTNIPSSVIFSKEIGDLVKSFNSMIGYIKKTTVSTEHLDNVFNSINDPLIITNKRRIVETVNNAALEILGYAGKDELIGKSLDDVACGTDLKKGNKNLFEPETFEQLLTNGYIREYSAIYKTKNGDKIPVSFSAKLLYDKKEGLRGLVCIARDVREHQKLQAQLLQSSKLAGLGTMSAGIAHELKNPLGVIMGKAEILSSMFVKGDDDSMAKDIETIIFCSERMTEIIAHLKVFSREAKEQDWKLLDIEDIIYNTFILIGKQLEYGNIKIIKEIGPDIPKIKGDCNMLISVFQNLITNTIDAFEDVDQSKEKIIKITVCLHERKYIKILFEDNACGMEKDVLENIFNPFFTTKEIGKGTGLGLSIIYGIIEEHNAKIDVRSVLGKGSTFSITFPVARSSCKENELLRERQYPKVKCRKILLVDDYDSIRDVTTEHLQRGGYTVETAQNGEEAVKKTRETKFDLIITDINMPVMNGDEAARIIRLGDSVNSHTPIMAMTANSDESDNEKYFEAGIDVIIEKPVRKKNLLDALERIFFTNSKACKTLLKSEKKISDNNKSFSDCEARSKDVLPPLDHEAFIKEVGSEEFALRVLKVYIASVCEQIKVIKEGILEDNFTLVHREAHSIKGGAANVLAESLMSAAKKLEHAAKNKDLKGAMLLLENIKHEFKTLNTYVDNLQ